MTSETDPSDASDPSDNGPRPDPMADTQQALERFDEDTLPAAPDPVMGGHMDALIGNLAGRDAPKGQRLGIYEVLRRIGAGGMGEVFAARHERTGELVALKTLSTTTAGRLYRFKLEFRSLADVSHPNLVRLHELYVPETGPAFFTMELLDGVPFVAWVRNGALAGELPDLARLEHALPQLVTGMHVLHAHDCIHRDLKPSNVLVTPEERVVVLDFGLISDLSEPERGITRDRQILGTPSYMAPEQALGRRVGPAADYYAIGVMLYECLTGRLPHQGTALQQLIAKQDATPDPGDAIADAPPWLRTLCMRLLARDPEARPGPRELLAQLRAPSPPTSVAPRELVGRMDELAALHGAWHELAGRSEPSIIHLRGRSGHGKSALLQRFRAELRETEALVLHGRCRERETVPYKGVDAIVDALSAHLRRLPPSERAALCPPDLDALVRVFPVLDELWEPAEVQSLALGELRTLGGVTLRKLLGRVADGRPLSIHIDDFQWADLDSVSLLQELVRPPNAPRMLLVLAYRSELEDTEALRELAMSEVLAGPHARTIELGPLSADDARELASTLLGLDDGEVDPQHRARAEAIALRAHGSPFFIAQMALGGGEPSTSDPDLDQIVVRRLSALERDARRLLEVVSVFGGPLPLDLALTLAGASSEAITSLCEQGLLVRESVRTGALDERIETAHDRVREVVLAELDSNERIRLHWELGQRLLARHDEASRGEHIFGAIEHLHAGTGAAGPLTDAQRLELAELGRETGQRALESTAWITARRCFGFAHELIQPWLAEAREGRGPHALCTAVTFGLAQANVTLNHPEGDAAIEDLLRWSLSMTDYCRIAEWYSGILGVNLRTEERIEFSIMALRRIGLRLSGRPSWLRALLSYAWGWRSLQRLGLERVRALPTITDQRIHVMMEILGGTALSSISTDIKLHLALIGRHMRLLTKHGLHDGTSVALGAYAISIAARGKHHEALALCELSEELAAHREISSAARQGTQAQLLLILPMLRPMRSVVERGEQVYRRACELAPRPLVEIIGLLHTINSNYASVPLPTLAAFLDTMESRHDGLMLPWVADVITATRRRIQALTAGSTELDLAKGLVHLAANLQYVAATAVAELATLVALGESDRAWELSCRIAHDYERRMGLGCHIPMFAMLGVVTIGDRWADASARERRRMRRLIRKRTAVAKRWALACRENYQPMLEIIEGEVAALDERYEQAMAAFERARTIASDHQTHWLTALASERLATLARRRGHGLVASAALDAAREACEDWGAPAVVQRIDRERAGLASDLTLDRAPSARA